MAEKFYWSEESKELYGSAFLKSYHAPFYSHRYNIFDSSKSPRLFLSVAHYVSVAISI